jgi:hypothetical protein
MSPEPSPLDEIMSASRSDGLTYDVVHEIVTCVQSEFPDATRPEVADEVRLRLNRLRRAWRAARARRTENGYLIRDWGPRRSNPPALDAQDADH